jgi:hypothetical protein
VARLRTRKQGILVRFPNKARYLRLLKRVKKTWELFNLISYFPGVKRPARDVCHSLSPNAEVTNG